MKFSLRVKIAWIIFMVVVLCLLGCNERMSSYELAQEKSNILSIEIIYIDPDTHIESGLKYLSTFDGIINDLEQLTYKEYWNDPCQVLAGNGIKIIYCDRSYEIITSFCNVYHSNNDRYGREYFDPVEFESLINNYL